MAYWDLLSAETGIAPWILILIVFWSAAWKIAALWKSARKNNVIWFLAIFIMSTMGILEILYIFIFSKIEAPKDNKKSKISKKETKTKKSSKKNSKKRK